SWRKSLTRVTAAAVRRHRRANNQWTHERKAADGRERRSDPRCAGHFFRPGHGRAVSAGGAARLSAITKDARSADGARWRTRWADAERCHLAAGHRQALPLSPDHADRAAGAVADGAL